MGKLSSRMVAVGNFSIKLFFFFPDLFIHYFRERERTWEGQGERRERGSQADSTQSPTRGSIHLTTWAKTKGPMSNPLCYPGTPTIKFYEKA